jgi:MFS family permease
MRVAFLDSWILSCPHRTASGGPEITKNDRSPSRTQAMASGRASFFISTTAFLDRQTLSVLEKTLEKILGFSAVEYSYIVIGFLIATGLGYLFAGGIIDRFGVRTSFAVALTVWSVAAVLTPWRQDGFRCWSCGSCWDWGKVSIRLLPPGY